MKQDIVITPIGDDELGLMVDKLMSTKEHNRTTKRNSWKSLVPDYLGKPPTERGSYVLEICWSPHKTVAQNWAITEMYLELVGKSGLPLVKMLECDCCRISPGKMLFFSEVYHRRVPSPANFRRTMLAMPPQHQKEFKLMELEILSGNNYKEMYDISEQVEVTVDDARRFNMKEKLNNQLHKKVEKEEAIEAEEKSKSIDNFIKTIENMDLTTLGIIAGNIESAQAEPKPTPSEPTPTEEPF